MMNRVDLFELLEQPIVKTNGRKLEKMNKEIFADGISAIHVTGNLVRIDLMSLQPQLKNDNSQPVVEVNKRIVMPLEGFVKAFDVQQNIVNQLMKAGVLKKNDQPQEM
ncbi:MAG: hypothetical protein H6Q74_294 [Firmicutes bacterium]|nr:hypothetical protein [Bacillota bacterium]